MSGIENLILDETVEERSRPMKEWLEENKPASKKEVNALIWLLVDWYKADGYGISNGRYGVIKAYGRLIVFAGGRTSLYVEGDAFRLRMIEILKCMRKDLP